MITINDDGLFEKRLNVVNTILHLRLLFAGVLILGVLAEISELLRIFEISCDFLASLRAKRLKLFSELLDLFFT